MRRSGATRRATLRRVSQGYQRRDVAVVDYQLWQAAPGGDWLRGPQPVSLAPGSYIACVGAAQTFGCFVERPWPALLAAQLGVPTLNLGVAGAGPALFRCQPFSRLIAGARAVVFQVMSGRSADCSLFHSGGRERLVRSDDGRVLGADEAWREELQRDIDGLAPGLLRGSANRVFALLGRRRVRALVAETRTGWIADFLALLNATASPKLLLWFSRRTPHYRPRWHSLAAMFGEFPQLVDERMVRAIATRADCYVQCVTGRGSPQPLIDRHSGRPTTVCPASAGTGESGQVRWTHNRYYPSPEMHEDAAAALSAPLRELLAPAGRKR